MDNNIKRYPRTTGEAFKDASYASAIERPAKRTLKVKSLLGLVLVVLVVVLLMGVA